MPSRSDPSVRPRGRIHRAIVGVGLAFLFAGGGALFVAFGHGFLPGILTLLLLATAFLVLGCLLSIAVVLDRALEGIQQSADEIAEQAAVIAVNTSAGKTRTDPEHPTGVASGGSPPLPHADA